MLTGLQFSQQHASDTGKQLEKDVIQSWQEFTDKKYGAHMKVIPAVEVILSIVEINSVDPGYQKPSIRVQTIFHGGNPSVKKDLGKRSKNFNKQFLPT